MLQSLYAPQNELLRKLCDAELSLLRSELELVPLNQGQAVHHRGLPIHDIYFIEQGLISVLAKVEGGRREVEVWTIGHEGMTGIPIVLNSEHDLSYKCIAEVGGAALRLAVPNLRRIMVRIPSFRDVSFAMWIRSCFMRASFLRAIADTNLRIAWHGG